jgi:predicted N-formylglutamate amidohydrolase
MHSFTPAFKGTARPWHVGVLYNRDRRFAGIVSWICCVRRAISSSATTSHTRSAMKADYTIPVHGERRGLPHVELEIRQDLIADADGQKAGPTDCRACSPRPHDRLPRSRWMKNTHTGDTGR